MNFRKDALKMLDEMTGGKKTKIEESVEVITEEVFETDFGSILENLDQEIDSIDEPVVGTYHQDFSRPESNEFKPKFLGKLYESPNPLEYPEGTMYKNTRNGVVYIKEGESWELLVEDGKNGSVGPQGQAGGSGAGVKEVQSIVETYTDSTVTNEGTTFNSSLSASIINYASIGGQLSLSTTFISNNLYDGVETSAGQYIDNDGTIKSLGGYAISNKIYVSPGDKYVLFNGQLGLDKKGGLYTGDTWVSNIYNNLAANGGLLIIPAGIDNIKITVRMTTQSNFAPVYVYKTNGVMSRKKYNRVESIGDSICRGMKTTKPFTTIVAETLGIPNIGNHGIDSSTITSSSNNPICGRMNTLNTAGDLVLFEGGGNDFNVIPANLGTSSDTISSTFYGSLNICAKYLQNNFPFSTIVWVAIPRWRSYATPNTYGNTMDVYINAFKEIAKSRGFLVADCYEKYNMSRVPNNICADEDGIHPGDIGHQFIADEILRVLGH